MGCTSSTDVDQSAKSPESATKETANEQELREKITATLQTSEPGDDKLTFPKKRLKETFLEHTKPTKGKADYILNPTGIYEKFLDFRSEKVPLKTTKRPIPIRRLWTDPDFNPEIVTNNHIEWIRPKVIPYDAYLVERPDYDGIFHCRFWNFGQWEDVYIDDFIPTIYKRESIVSARSVEKNEMWVTLLEKAFAKFWGGYTEIENNDLIMDAHRCLTGGMSEMILSKDKKKNIQPQEIFHRLESSLLRANTSATACVDEASDGKFGLEGDHAFSVTGTATAKMKNGEEVQLVCLRNPWGGTEWTGPWSEMSKDWDNVVSGVIKPEEDEGEFYISVKDFCKYFESCTICDLTPDINRDGTGEEFDYLTSIYAEWKGDSAAGRDNFLQNTKILFTVSDDGTDKQGLVPLGLSLVQQTIEEEDLATIYIQLYKVLGENDEGLIIEHYLENCLKQIQVHDGKRVKPGRYMVLVLSDPPRESDCLVRLFKYEEVIWGKWIRDINLGGQICETNFGLNPQLELSIPGTGNTKQAVKFQMLKGRGSSDIVLGLRIFKISNEETMPKSTNWFWDKEQTNQTLKSTDGKVEGWEWNYIQPAYVLTPGRYCVVLYHSDETKESSFCLLVKSTKSLTIKSYHLDEKQVLKERAEAEAIATTENPVDSGNTENLENES
ncbi:hypothetical protein KUTeg_008893 [Tegillarca granosa]|uniref:Calpain catalytic domain-containing protein n=1 Tax=Tegillarca granosa TaxID=220873 RepID=A0ABQ9FAG2_TEGGR|nr:hypothetical protein KUTeg_008893 [Tegillarca granosa]